LLKKNFKKKINLFTEKPPSLTYDQFISLLNISKKNKLRYLVGYMRRYEDSVNFIKKKLVNKKIVSLTVENFNGDSYFNPINYYRVNYLSKPKKNSYYNYLNSHSHDINLIRYFMGDIKLIYKEFNKKGEGLALFKNKIKVNIFFTNRYLKSTNWHQIYKFDLGNQIITLELPPPFLINASSILKITDLKNGSNFKKKLKGIWSFKRESQIIVNDIINNKINRTEASTCLADLKIIENLFNN
jgi:hypothetical protein